MSPFYGTKPPPAGDYVPDWLMGGHRKRQVLSALAYPVPSKGWKVAELAEQLACGPSTVYEIVRGLRAAGVVHIGDDGRVRLDRTMPLGRAIAHMVTALSAYAASPVDRPPRRRSAAPQASEARSATPATLATEWCATGFDAWLVELTAMHGQRQLSPILDVIALSA